ncbi:RNA 2',3'-cyclic phosphodiesterase, partial [bacterium]|nr:RNA 2',3'-cyclic phosphodiesterase [bacterium]
FHITLFFLGSVEEPQIAKITAISKLLLKNHKIFTARFTNSEVYPSFKDAKLVWLRSASNFDLVSLQEKIVTQLKLHGFKFENRIYLPHATLGQIKKPIKNVESLMKDLSTLMLDGFLISHIDIMESIQTKKESTYKILFRVPLENSIVSKNIFV